MNDILCAFLNEVDEVQSHLVFIDNLKDDIKDDSINFSYYKSQSRKRFEYNAIIISLYGLIERYTEIIVKRYIEEIENLFTSYEDIDSKIKDKHFDLSIQLLTKIIDGKHKKYDHLRKVDVLKNLNDCVNKTGSFLFNKDAFILNSGNIQHAKICDYFNNLAFNIEVELRKCDDFTKKTENAFNKLDELVQRRNEIAHGNISEILSFSEIIPLIDFLRKYFKGIIKVLNENIQQETNKYKADKYGRSLMFSVINSNIIGLEDGAKLGLSEGDELIIRKGNGQYLGTKVEEIRNYSNTQNISVKIDEKIKKEHQIWAFDKRTYDSDSD